MGKRGQVTIFIIIALVIIAIVVLVYVFRDSLGINFTNSETSGIKGFVESCIEGTGEDAILFLSQNSGYFLTPEFSTQEGIPYYYFNGRSYLPSKERIENETSLYMNSLLSSCTNEFVNFPDFNITEGRIDTRTSIREGEITFNVEYPLTIKKGEDESTIIKDFKNIKIPIDILLVYHAIEEMINGQIEQRGEGICISCISEIASRDSLLIDITPIDEDMIFVVKNENQVIKGLALEWRFANRYE